MRRGRAPGTQGRVGDVRPSFSADTERGGRFDPAHRQNHRERNQGVRVRHAVDPRHDKAEFEDVAHGNKNLVKTVGHVDLIQVDRPPAGVRKKNTRQDAEKRAAKLHRLRRGEPDGVAVDPRKGVVDDGARPAVALGHNTGRADPQGRPCHERGNTAGQPIALVTHFEHFGAQEQGMLHGRGVGPRATAASFRAGDHGAERSTTGCPIRRR